MFVKSPPQQFSVHFFCSPPTFFSSHAEKNIILSPLSRRYPPSVDRSPGIFFYSPPLLRARRPNWQAASTPPSRGERETAHRSSLHTAHSPAAHEKWGATKGKLGTFAQKRGCSDRNTPVFGRKSPIFPSWLPIFRARRGSVRCAVRSDAQFLAHRVKEVSKRLANWGGGRAEAAGSKKICPVTCRRMVGIGGREATK